tara:strand:- start:4933 stop:5280 length:348 start_codon:yes stop_codon:yes gene_type:complete
MKKEIEIVLHASEKDRRRILPFLDVAFEDSGLSEKVEHRGFVKEGKPYIFRAGKVSVWLEDEKGKPYFRVTSGDEQVYRGVGGNAHVRCGLDDIMYVAPQIAYQVKKYLEQHSDS